MNTLERAGTDRPARFSRANRSRALMAVFALALPSAAHGSEAATVTEVGCVYTGVFLPPLFDSPPPSDYERGYILAPFHCGSDPDTCRVEIGDDVIEGAEGVEDRDDTETEHRWACRSDTGEVRECRKAK